MYAYKTIAKRRPSGWVERRRYFKRILVKAGSPSVKDVKKPSAS